MNSRCILQASISDIWGARSDLVESPIIRADSVDPVDSTAGATLLKPLLECFETGDLTATSQLTQVAVIVASAAWQTGENTDSLCSAAEVAGMALSILSAAVANVPLTTFARSLEVATASASAAFAALPVLTGTAACGCIHSIESGIFGNIIVIVESTTNESYDGSRTISEFSQVESAKSYEYMQAIGCSVAILAARHFLASSFIDDCQPNRTMDSNMSTSESGNRMPNTTKGSDFAEFLSAIGPLVDAALEYAVEASVESIYSKDSTDGWWREILDVNPQNFIGWLSWKMQAGIITGNPIKGCSAPMQTENISGISNQTTNSCNSGETALYLAAESAAKSAYAFYRATDPGTGKSNYSQSAESSNSSSPVFFTSHAVFQISFTTSQSSPLSVASNHSINNHPVSTVGNLSSSNHTSSSLQKTLVQPNQQGSSPLQLPTSQYRKSSITSSIAARFTPTSQPSFSVTNSIPINTALQTSVTTPPTAGSILQPSPPIQTEWPHGLMALWSEQMLMIPPDVAAQATLISPIAVRRVLLVRIPGAGSAETDTTICHGLDASSAKWYQANVSGKNLSDFPWDDAATVSITVASEIENFPVLMMRLGQCVMWNDIDWMGCNDDNTNRELNCSGQTVSDNKCQEINSTLLDESSNRFRNSSPLSVVCNQSDSNWTQECTVVCKCSAALQSGFFIAASFDVCAAACGNGWLDPGEQCDDGNSNGGDGCSTNCSVEAGWACEANENSAKGPECPQNTGTMTCVPAVLEMLVISDSTNLPGVQNEVFVSFSVRVPILNHEHAQTKFGYRCIR